MHVSLSFYFYGGWGGPQHKCKSPQHNVSYPITETGDSLVTIVITKCVGGSG